MDKKKERKYRERTKHQKASEQREFRYAMMSPTINPQSQTANLCNIASANSTNLIKT